MADLGAPLGRRTGEGHREGPGVEPVSDVHEPRARHVAGQPGLVVADVARPRDVVDGEAVTLGSGDGLMGCADVSGVHRHEHRAHRLGVEPHIERRLRPHTPVHLEARPGHRHVHVVYGQHPQPLVAARRVRREVVALEQGHRCAARGELERARGADHPASHDDHVGHAAQPTRGPRDHAGRIVGGDVPEWPKGAAC